MHLSRNVFAAIGRACACAALRLCLLHGAGTVADVLDDVLLRLKMIVFPTLCEDEEACN